MSHLSNQSKEEILASEFQRIQLQYYNQIAALQRSSQVSQSCENSTHPSNQQSLSFGPSFTQELYETDFTQLGLPQPLKTQEFFFCITKKEVKYKNISGLSATSTGVLLDTAGSHRTLTR